MIKEAFSGEIARAKVYPMCLSRRQVSGVYIREHSWWGRILNDIDYYLKRSLM